MTGDEFYIAGILASAIIATVILYSRWYMGHDIKGEHIAWGAVLSFFWPFTTILAAVAWVAGITDIKGRKK